MRNLTKVKTETALLQGVREHCIEGLHLHTVQVQIKDDLEKKPLLNNGRIKQG